MNRSEITTNLVVVALAGGVGGARMADGLARVLPAEKFTVIVNTGDDFQHLGLRICPDIDTVMYTLAGVGNRVTGWGRADESWRALETVGELGGPTWFHLGDRDLGLNLERTRRLENGQTLSEIINHFCQALGVAIQLLPMSNEPVATQVHTEEGTLAFQDYFVRRQCQPRVTGFQFEGIEQAKPAPGVLRAIEDADLVVICPSNPWVSIDPILAVPGIREAVERRVSIAITPIIGSQTIKGPAAKMFTELGLEPSARSVAEHYSGLISGFLLDQADVNQSQNIRELGMGIACTDTIMKTPHKRIRLAKEVLEFGRTLMTERRIKV